MTPDAFRRTALSMPLAIESAHMGHPDFRISNRIFATLWPNDGWGMVKLTPAEQRRFVRETPAAFEPIKGAWGKRGATRVQLDEVDTRTLRKAMTAAWRNSAPKSLVKELGLALED